MFLKHKWWRLCIIWSRVQVEPNSTQTQTQVESNSTRWWPITSYYHDFTVRLMPNEAFGRLNVKTAPFYLAFRNLSSIDSNHKKIRVCVFQNKSGQVNKYRDEKHKIFYRNCHSLNLPNVEIQQKTESYFLLRCFFKCKMSKKSTIQLSVWNWEFDFPLLIPCCFFVAQMSSTIMRSIWTKY